MKTKLLILGILLCYLQTSVKSQINFSADNRIETAMQKRLHKETIGYRIQLAFDSDKNKVDLVRLSFLNQFPEIETYINFEAPNFNLKAGNFRTLIEAEIIKEKMVLQYPLNNILKDKINLPSIN